MDVEILTWLIFLFTIPCGVAATLTIREMMRHRKHGEEEKRKK